MSVAKQMTLNDITYEINGAVFEVNRVLGAGFLEKVYENALVIELQNRGLKAKNQAPIRVRYKGEIVGDYFADIVVEDRVILELKAIDKLQNIHEAQLLNYLKATGYKVGLLVNFRYPKAEIKRMVWDLPEGHDTDLDDVSSSE
jgi:GxxExxY protein